jgi:TonB family protein
MTRATSAVAALLLSCAPAATEPTGVRSARGVFEVGSRDAWTLVRRQLADLGLRVASVDHENQALLTKWRRVPGEGDWLPTPLLPEAYRAERVRFLVFVSPFVEPAHVYVGSLMEATTARGPRVPALVYNDPEVNQALLAQVASVLTAPGTPRFVPDDTGACPRGRLEAGEKPAPPRTIPISEFEVVYPGPDARMGAGGVVRLELQIREDGGVGEVNLVGPPVGGQLAAAATGAVSLLLYSPPRIDGCPISFVATYTVRFRAR